MEAPVPDQNEVLIVGRYFCDLVFSGLPEFPRLGHEVYSREFHLIPGGVYNAAVALHRLRVKLIWPCGFGNDPFSQYVRNEAEKEGMDSTYFSNLSYPSLRLTAAFSFNSERAFLSYADPLPAYAYSELITETRPRWIYLTHLMLGEELHSLTDAGRAVSANILMDCQAHHHTLAEPQLQDALRSVDIFSPNRAEAELLTGEKEVPAILGALCQYTPLVVMKDGANGSALKSGDEFLQQPAEKVRVVDTTGAGDNFDSGFLYGLLRGYALKQCLRIGNLCGGLSAEGFGGTTTSPTEEELHAHLKS